MRPYLHTDLLWIEPIAKKYGEWPQLLHTLTYGLIGIVEEPYAIMMVYLDEHGIAVAGLADKEGMRPLIKLSRFIAEMAQKKDMELHGHWEKGSWQEKLAIKNGFIFNGRGYHILEKKEG